MMIAQVFPRGSHMYSAQNQCHSRNEVEVGPALVQWLMMLTLKVLVMFLAVFSISFCSWNKIVKAMDFNFAKIAIYLI